MKPLTPKCQEMLDAVKAAGECHRMVRSGTWHVGGRYFHQFTGDALVNRLLLEHFVERYDGNHCDRFKPSTVLPPGDQSK